MATREFVFSQAAALDAAGVWHFDAGSFITQTTNDMLAYNASNGTVWVGQNVGTGFEFQQWATVSPVDGWQFVAGDFTGSGLADIMGYHPSNGSLWLGENTGGGFEFTQWGSVDPADGWQFNAGYFMGHAKKDLFGYHPSNGSLWVGENVGDGFSFQEWGNVDPADGWTFITDDFTGNGRTDFVGYQPSNGSLWVGENTGSTFNLDMWAQVDPPGGWQFAAGRFTASGRSDVFGDHPSNGPCGSARTWGPVSPSTSGAAPTRSEAGPSWPPPSTTICGDIAGYQASNGVVSIGQSTLRPVEGYCWPLSAAPGATIQCMMSGQGASQALIQSHSSTSSAIDSVTMMTLNFDAVEQPLPAMSWQLGCGWDESFSLTIPNTWASGIYAATCTDEEGTDFDVTFVVKPAVGDRTNIALLANVNTWLAYNGWGGESKYSGRAKTSFMRPNYGASPAADFHLTRGDLWVLGWLSSIGARPDVYSDLDFHNAGCDASQYSCLVLSTHPEYWSRQMYDNLSTYLDAAGVCCIWAATGSTRTANTWWTRAGWCSGKGWRVVRASVRCSEC